MSTCSYISFALKQAKILKRPCSLLQLQKLKRLTLELPFRLGCLTGLLVPWVASESCTFNLQYIFNAPRLTLSPPICNLCNQIKWYIYIYIWKEKWKEKRKLYLPSFMRRRENPNIFKAQSKGAIREGRNQLKSEWTRNKIRHIMTFSWSSLLNGSKDCFFCCAQKESYWSDWQPWSQQDEKRKKRSVLVLTRKKSSPCSSRSPGEKKTEPDPPTPWCLTTEEIAERIEKGSVKLRRIDYDVCKGLWLWDENGWTTLMNNKQS